MSEKKMRERFEAIKAKLTVDLVTGLALERGLTFPLRIDAEGMKTLLLSGMEEGWQACAESMQVENARLRAERNALFARLNPSIEDVEGTPVGYGEDEIDRLHSLLDTALARVAELEGNEKAWRNMLFLAHGGPEHNLYGDDGERFCNTCWINFNIDSPETIELKMTNWGNCQIQKLQVEGKWPPHPKPADVPERGVESAWLIEQPIVGGSDNGIWWVKGITKEGGSEHFRWTKDSLEAIKFPSKECAEDMLVNVLGCHWKPSTLTVTEHLWLSSAPKGERND